MKIQSQRIGSLTVLSTVTFGLILFARTAQAQQPNALPSSGNVGVGVTTDLGTLLTVGRDLELDSYNDGTTRWGLVQAYDRTSGAQAARPLWLEGSKFFFSGGNIGIGTKSPVGRLEILGDTYSVPASSGTTPAGLIARFRDSRLSGDVVLDLGSAAGTGAGAMWLQSTDMRGLNANYNLLLNPNGGNVGIGVTSPDTSLNVKATHNTWRIGDVYTSSNQYAGISDSAPDATSYFLLSRVGMSGGDRYVNAPTNGSLDLQIGGTTALAIVQNRNVGVGTSFTSPPTEKLEVNGNLKLSGTGNINAAGTIEAGNIVAKYQDVAEWVPSSQQLAAGTVVVLDSTKSNQVISSTQSYDTRVAGVISAQPGITLGEKSDSKVLVATTGRVKMKVDASKGPIHIGDLLVTSDVPGVAMKSEEINLGGVKIHRPGTLIGKALEPLEKGKGEILVLLSLQ